MTRSDYWAGVVAHVVAIVALAMSALELAFEDRMWRAGLCVLGVLWAIVSLFVLEVRAGKELDR